MGTGQDAIKKQGESAQPSVLELGVLEKRALEIPKRLRPTTSAVH